MKELETTELYKIIKLSAQHYRTIAELWENSVRNTHDFLTEEDITFYRPLIIKHYLPSLKLYGVETNNSLAGFMGIDNSKIEMLFIAPDRMGKGIGKSLLHYAVRTFDCEEVDVNEQNIKAVKFYKNNGFSVISRSETDLDGRNFPILHLKYNIKQIESIDSN